MGRGRDAETVLSFTYLHGPEAAKGSLVDDLAVLPGVSRDYAFKLVDDLEYWALENARFIVKDITPLIEPQLQAAVRKTVRPMLMAMILFGVATSAVSFAALVSIRRTRLALERNTGRPRLTQSVFAAARRG